ncbi:MAG TPA: LptF/LptG family permease [Candidatus Omnitrophota bacterium]|nr:LptF/LptG family permease [Candidatus Omnitrophota bacterium]
MRILDRYLIRHLIIPILFCTFTLMFLVIMADVFDHLSDFIKNRTLLSYILPYYLNLCPFVFIQIIPWATFLGTMFLLTFLNTHNEILAMKTAGIGISKIIRPILFVGFILGIACFLISDRLVPETYRRSQQILEERIEQRNESQKDTNTQVHNFTYLSSASKLYYAKLFDAKNSVMEGLIILFFDAQKKVERKIFAKLARWQNGKWVLTNVTDYETDASGKMTGDPRASAEKISEDITESPRELSRASVETNFMSYRELKRHIQRMQESGLNTDPERVILYQKLAAPWYSVIMMLVSVPFLAITRRKKVIALNVLYCVALIFVFHATGAFTMALGRAGNLNPFVSAWSNNFIFLIGSIFFLDRANE